MLQIVVVEDLAAFEFLGSKDVDCHAQIDGVVAGILVLFLDLGRADLKLVVAIRQVGEIALLGVLFCRFNSDANLGHA
ncbi:hypothetical protein D3C71_2074590 [compost metagenome]